MKTIARRLKMKFIFGSIITVIMSFLGFLLLVVDGGSAKEDATYPLVFAGIFFVMSMIDLLLPPRNLICIKNNAELLIRKCRKVTIIDAKKPVKEGFISLRENEISSVITDEESDGGFQFFGMLGYLLSVKSVNTLVINLKSGGKIVINDIFNPKKTARKIEEFRGIKVEDYGKEDEEELYY